jgi:hypothetical protein
MGVARGETNFNAIYKEFMAALARTSPLIGIAIGPQHRLGIRAQNFIYTGCTKVDP